MQLGEFISSLRKMRGWTQSDLAQKMGLTRYAVMAWEKDRVKLSEQKKVALAKAFQIEPADFDKIQDLEIDDVENMYQDLAEDKNRGERVLPSQGIIEREQRETDFNALYQTLDKIIEQLKGTKKIRELGFALKMFEGAIDEIEKTISDFQSAEGAKVKLPSQEYNESENSIEKE